MLEAPEIAAEVMEGLVASSLTRDGVSQTLYRRKRAIAETWRCNPSLASRATDYLWPWSRKHYPGLHAGICLTLKVSVTWQCVQHWLMGRNRFPHWAASAMLTAIESRVSAGATLAAELRAHIAALESQPTHQPGRLTGRHIPE